MLNKLLAQIRRYRMIEPGSRVVCALSGGADSVALLFGLYLLKEKLDFRLCAAHFNHGLRGAESDRDEAFVREFCQRYDIPLHVGRGQVTAGKKGLEAAAREARYGFLRTLPGTIATAHTADDNAETVLLHLVRGTGLKGLGGIAPVNGNVIRPMLTVTRQEVEDFLAEWSLPHVEDSSNETDKFLRNRLRHRVMPLLREENPRLAENLSAMAMRLRQDEDCLRRAAGEILDVLPVGPLRAMHPAVRARALEGFLKRNGVPEPEAEHIALAEALVFSENPSAAACFPGGVTIARRYGLLERRAREELPGAVALPRAGSLELPQWGIRVTCGEADCVENSADTFTVRPQGTVILRAREAGDTIRLSGGTKTLKKCFIDRKIPAAQRPWVPVIADEAGILGVAGIGVNLDRRAQALPAVRIQIEKLQ